MDMRNDNFQVCSCTLHCSCRDQSHTRLYLRENIMVKVNLIETALIALVGQGGLIVSELGSM